MKKYNRYFISNNRHKRSLYNKEQFLKRIFPNQKLTIVFSKAGVGKSYISKWIEKELNMKRIDAYEFNESHLQDNIIIDSLDEVSFSKALEIIEKVKNQKNVIIFTREEYIKENHNETFDVYKMFNKGHKNPREDQYGKNPDVFQNIEEFLSQGEVSQSVNDFMAMLSFKLLTLNVITIPQSNLMEDIRIYNINNNANISIELILKNKLVESPSPKNQIWKIQNKTLASYFAVLFLKKFLNQKFSYLMNFNKFKNQINLAEAGEIIRKTKVPVIKALQYDLISNHNFIFLFLNNYENDNALESSLMEFWNNEKYIDSLIDIYNFVESDDDYVGSLYFYKLFEKFDYKKLIEKIKNVRNKKIKHIFYRNIIDSFICNLTIENNDYRRQQLVDIAEELKTNDKYSNDKTFLLFYNAIFGDIEKIDPVEFSHYLGPMETAILFIIKYGSDKRVIKASNLEKEFGAFYIGKENVSRERKEYIVDLIWKDNPEKIFVALKWFGEELITSAFVKIKLRTKKFSKIINICKRNHLNLIKWNHFNLIKINPKIIEPIQKENSTLWTSLIYFFVYEDKIKKINLKNVKSKIIESKIIKFELPEELFGNKNKEIGNINEIDKKRINLNLFSDEDKKIIKQNFEKLKSERKEMTIFDVFYVDKWFQIFDLFFDIRLEDIHPYLLIRIEHIAMNRNSMFMKNPEDIKTWWSKWYLEEKTEMKKMMRDYASIPLLEEMSNIGVIINYEIFEDCYKKDKTNTIIFLKKIADKPNYRNNIIYLFDKYDVDDNFVLNLITDEQKDTSPKMLWQNYWIFELSAMEDSLKEHHITEMIDELMTHIDALEEDSRVITIEWFNDIFFSHGRHSNTIRLASYILKFELMNYFMDKFYETFKKLIINEKKDAIYEFVAKTNSFSSLFDLKADDLLDKMSDDLKKHTYQYKNFKRAVLDLNGKFIDQKNQDKQEFSFIRYYKYHNDNISMIEFIGIVEKKIIPDIRRIYCEMEEKSKERLIHSTIAEKITNKIYNEDNIILLNETPGFRSQKIDNRYDILLMHSSKLIMFELKTTSDPRIKNQDQTELYDQMIKYKENQVISSYNYLVVFVNTDDYIKKHKEKTLLTAKSAGYKYIEIDNKK
ncbi:hypothetical protein [Candidatus Mycoplasma mahonii]|uniref:hypothetical protein n=1 Tax=Candidatus Mycoplasma mahonii TaxID=3004105 RepID=UPI0026EE13F1|nr:hypothetical protein [Candidatus Mycoplasma mahonii]WKX02276.1 hypothetical protein O3I44_02630 [Candidatus Mycoplasma mahonii]